MTNEGRPNAGVKRQARHRISRRRVAPRLPLMLSSARRVNGVSRSTARLSLAAHMLPPRCSNQLARERKRGDIRRTPVHGSHVSVSRDVIWQAMQRLLQEQTAREIRGATVRTRETKGRRVECEWKKDEALLPLLLCCLSPSCLQRSVRPVHRSIRAPLWLCS